MREIEWHRAKLKRFKRSYQIALQKRHVKFTFEGTEFLTSYAHYLIKFLEQQLAK